MAFTASCLVNLHAQTPELFASILNNHAQAPPYISGQYISRCREDEGCRDFGPTFSPRHLHLIPGPPFKQQLVAVRPGPEAYQGGAKWALSIVHSGRGNDVCVAVDAEYPGSEIVVRRGKWAMIPIAARAEGETVEVKLYDTSDGGWDALEEFNLWKKEALNSLVRFTIVP